jgi:hypothetical protein
LPGSAVTAGAASRSASRRIQAGKFRRWRFTVSYCGEQNTAPCRPALRDHVLDLRL